MQNTTVKLNITNLITNASLFALTSTTLANVEGKTYQEYCSASIFYTFDAVKDVHIQDMGTVTQVVMCAHSGISSRKDFTLNGVEYKNDGMSTECNYTIICGDKHFAEESYDYEFTVTY